MTDLTRLPIGVSATVMGIHCMGRMRRRLMDIGMTPGARVTCLFAAMGGHVRAYRVRGAVIALREGVASQVRIGGAGHE